LFANAGASIKCTGIGGRSAITTLFEAINFLQSQTDKNKTCKEFI